MSIFSMSHCDKSVPQGCNAVKTWLAMALISLKPASCVPQGCNAIKTRLARALIPLKPAPDHKSSAKQLVVSRAHGVFNCVRLQVEEVYNIDDITFVSSVLTFASRFGLQHIITLGLGKH